MRIDDVVEEFAPAMVILEETVMKFTIALATTGQPLIYRVSEDVSEAGSLLPGRGLELTQKHHEYEQPGTAWLPRSRILHQHRCSDRLG